MMYSTLKGKPCTRMARVVLHLLIVALFVKYSSANCSDEIIQKIKKLNGTKVFSNFPDIVTGSYRFEYLDTSKSSFKYLYEFASATFYTTANGKMIAYNGGIYGQYLLQFKNNTIEQLENLNPVAAIIVKAEGRPAEVNAAKELLKKLGFKHGFKFNPCTV